MSWNKEAEHAAAREWGARNYNWIIKWRIAKTVFWWTLIAAVGLLIFAQAR